MPKSPVNTGFHAPSVITYDERIRAVVPGYAELHRLAAAALLTRHSPVEPCHIVASGAGTGMELVELAQLAAPWMLTAIEPSETMLAQARARCEAYNIAHRVQFMHCTQAAFNSERAFDAVTSMLVAHFIPHDGQRERYYAQLRALLSARGTLVLAEILRWPNHVTLQHAWRRAARAAGCSADTIEASEQHVERSFACLTEPELTTLLARAGFSHTERIAQFLNVGLYLVHA